METALVKRPQSRTTAQAQTRLPPASAKYACKPGAAAVRLCGRRCAPTCRFPVASFHRSCQLRCSPSLLSRCLAVVGMICQRRNVLRLWNFWTKEDAVENNGQDTQHRHYQSQRLGQPLPDSVTKRYLRIRRQPTVKLRLCYVM